MKKILTITLALCCTLLLQAAKVEKDVTIKVDGKKLYEYARKGQVR